MPMINTPAGPVFFAGTDAEGEAIKKKLEVRASFVVEYCRSKGWPEDPEQLSIAQILEIRKQPGWENP